MLDKLRIVLNHRLEEMARPEVHLFGTHWSAFQVCGCAGLVLALAVSVILVRNHNHSQLVMMIIILSAILTFLALVIATTLITGEEKIIYYHHEIAVVLVTGLLLLLMRRQILPYLDITITGIGVFLAFGRIGCFMVGCCHGRPSRWGVCYRDEHAAVGFLHHYVGVRLFPIQVVESFSVLFVVVVGMIQILEGSPAGTTLAWYATAYGVLRFCFEFLRGDPDRPYLWGFSQPQWISLLLILLTIGAELAGVLPRQPWHAIAGMCLISAMIAVAVARRFDKVESFRLLHPRHIEEIAAALDALGEHLAASPEPCPWSSAPQRNSTNIAIASTSLGVRLSAAPILSPRGVVHHYALSLRGEGPAEAAGILARQILLLKQADGELIQGNRGVFHLLIHPPFRRKELFHS
jgi:prolipoprotein diacylglyceryltransferase